MRRIKLILTMLVIVLSQQLSANDFFFGFTGQGSNAWFTPMQLPVYYLNSAIGGGTSGVAYDWLHISNTTGEKVDINNGRFFGFRARDMFNNFGIGLQVTYQPQYSIFGMWVEAKYRYRQFRLALDSNSERQKYQVPGWSAGVGIRLTPFKAMLEEHSWSPFVDFGTSYNDVFGVKAPYGNDKEQFGTGLASTFGVGVRLCEDYDEQSWNIRLSFTMPHYNYFNRDYESMDGSKPYEHIRSRAYSVALSIQVEF